MNLDLIRELLGADEDTAPAELLHRARTVSFTLPPVLLSAAAHENHRMGSGSQDELRRHRARLALYGEIADAVAVHGVRPVKGPALARFHPAWTVRTCGDLDLVAPDEESLWQAARQVAAMLPVTGLQLTLVGDGDERHLLVGLSAPAAEPWLDPELKVELSTFAFMGDLDSVPLRAALPHSQAAAQLLAVAEERFQRPFTVRDVLDLLAVLSSAEAPEPAVLAGIAARWHLAPELRELLALAATFPTAAALVPRGYADALEEPAAAELARRTHTARPEDDTAPAGAAETAPERMRRRLAAGGPVADRIERRYPVFGMPLQVEGDFPPADRATVHTSGDLHVLTTPLGAFLLVSSALVAPDDYRAAQGFARSLAATAP